MTKRKSGERKESAPIDRVVKRSGQPRQQLPPQIEAFARGDDDALWRRELRGGRIQDPRVVALIPGVKNADARTVYEWHVDRIRAAMKAGDEERVARELAVVHATASFRGYSIVSFEAFAEAVLGMPADEAFSRAREGRASMGLPDALTEEEIAVWLRAEAGVREGSREATIEVIGGQLNLRMRLTDAARVLASVGFREAPMAKAQETPRTVIDRPAGVPSMRAIREKEERSRRGE